MSSKTTAFGFATSDFLELQVKSEEKDGYSAVQVGYQVCKENRITKPELYHLRKVNAPAMKTLVEFRVGPFFLPLLDKSLLDDLFGIMAEAMRTPRPLKKFCECISKLKSVA